MRSVDLDGPLVSAYLARLDAVSVSLPQGRRAELLADIRGHLTEALADVEPGDVDAVRAVLDRLGAPEDIVAAELGDPPGEQPVAPVAGASARPVEVAASPWGGLELVAVLLLTLGHLVLWVVGPLAGLVLAWLSPRWTRREKVVATVWTALPLAIIVLGGLFLFAARAAPSSEVQIQNTEVTAVTPMPADQSVPEVSP